MVYVICFLLPAIIWFFSTALSGIFPFGNNTIFTSDMAFQYVGYFEYIRQILTEGISPFFSFYKGLGEETLGMISYYMMSPFNLILALFPKENITEGIMVINLLKIGASGLTFSIFIKNKFKNYENKNLAVIAFSCCYALMAYNIAYQFNIMWLDAVIWLPIIILGIDRIINKNKSELFYISLAIAIVSNWYIGFMICVFCVFYVVYSLIILEDVNLVKMVLKKFTVFGIMAAGTALIVIFPAALTCFNELERELILEESAINYTLLDIFSKFIIGGFEFSQITDSNSSVEYLNLPNLFAGTSVLILFIIYFLNPGINKKQKSVDGIFGLFLLALTLFTVTNRIWHVFTYNVWFPYRYSFCLTFYMIYIAYKSFLSINNIDMKIVWKVLLSLMLGCFIIEKLKYAYIMKELVYGTIFISFAFCIIIKLIKNAEKKAYGFFLLLVCIECLLNTGIYMKNFSYVDRNEFYADRNKMEEELGKIDNYGFHRIENNLIDDYNSSLGLNYLGMTSSSSMGKESSRGLFESLGYTRVANNSIKYSTTTRFSDNFLGIKYYIDNDIKVNEDALSIGFLVNNSILEIKDFLTKWGEHSNSFEKQNELVKKIVNVQKNLYNPIKIRDISMENLEEVEKGKYKKIYPEAKALYSFNFTAPNDNDIYFKINGNVLEQAKIFINDKESLEYMTRENYSVIKLGKFSLEEVVNIDIEFVKAKDIELKDIWVYYEDNDVYDNVMKELKESQLKVNNMTSSLINGEIDINKDEQLLLLTIPYDTYLKVYIDDVETETVCALDSLVAVPIDIGSHTIEIKYEPDYLTFIIAISGMFIIFASILILLEYRKVKCEKVEKY